MTVSNLELKKQYNILLEKITALEEAGMSAGNRKYTMLTDQAKELHRTIASQESVFDINSFEDSIKFFTQKEEHCTFIWGFNVSGIKYPILKNLEIRSKMQLDSKNDVKPSLPEAFL